MIARPPKGKESRNANLGGLVNRTRPFVFEAARFLGFEGFWKGQNDDGKKQGISF
jgi:hypothetical protein